MLVLCVAIVSAVLFTRTIWRREKGFCTVHASVRAPESVIEVRVDVILDDRLQQVPDGGQVLLAKHGKLVQELRSPADICEILSAVRKGEPVVARKGDACSCCAGSFVVLERKIRSPWLGFNRRGEP